MTKEDMTRCDAVRRGIDKRVGRGTVVHVNFVLEGRARP